MKEAHYPSRTATYEPVHMLVDGNRIVDNNMGHRLKNSNGYHVVDALFHYFEHEDATEWAEEDYEGKPPLYVTLARCLDRNYHGNIYAMDVAEQHQEPKWTRFRDTASFIGGEVLDGEANRVANYFDMYNKGNTIILDAAGWTDESAEGTDPGPLYALMQLANNTKTVIEDRLVNEFANDSRGLINFLNATPGDHIFPDDNGTNTKWLVEARYLNSALIDIPGFKKNWNVLIIKNAMRYILTDQFNVNQLYRLLAKLGRVNSRVIFLG